MAIGLMIQDDEVSVLEVEAIELVAGLFGVYNIFVDNECGTLCVVCDALADLADGTELAKELKEFVGTDVVVEVLDEKRAGPWLARLGLVGEIMRAKAYRFTSGASLPPRLIAWIQVDGVYVTEAEKAGGDSAGNAVAVWFLDVRPECQGRGITAG